MYSFQMLIVVSFLTIKVKFCVLACSESQRKDILCYKYCSTVYHIKSQSGNHYNYT